jgi:hypothetical protein
VMNVFAATLNRYFRRRLMKPIRVNRKTGFIAEADALEIERGATRAVSSVLLTDDPKASSVQVRLSRADNVLATKTLTVDGRAVPLGYPEFVDLSIGFLNPAMLLQAA